MKDGCLRSVKKTRHPSTSHNMVEQDAMLEGIWQELDYWLDVCHATNGAHIEHFMKNLGRQVLEYIKMHGYILDSF